MSDDPWHEEDGRTVYHLDDNELTDDWIRAARLKERAKAGDTEAQAEMDRLEATPSPKTNWGEGNEDAAGELEELEGVPTHVDEE